MKTFKGRVIAPGNVSAEALVSHGGLNTLASFQKAYNLEIRKQLVETKTTKIYMANKWLVRHYVYLKQSVLQQVD